MVSVQPNNAPFGMPGSYQPMASPTAFAGVGGIGNPGSIVAAGGAVQIPNIQRDGNNNSNRVIPYHRVVGINDEERVKQIEDLQGGSLALIGALGQRRRRKNHDDDAPTRMSAQQSGPDSFSNLASLKHAQKILETNAKEVELAFDPNLTNGATGIPNIVANNGHLNADGSKADPLFPRGVLAARYDDIYRPGSRDEDDGCCFLAPHDDFMTDPGTITSSGGSKRHRTGTTTNHNDKLPSSASKFILQELYASMANSDDGPQPFTKWSPDGLVIYKYATSDEKLSSRNTGSLDYQLDQKQGAVYNIAVSGPALCIDWTNQDKDFDMSKRCMCLPRNNVYLLVVAKKENKTLLKASMRFIRTTSCDLSEHANAKDWMGLQTNELIIGGWSIGSVVDNAATPMTNHDPAMKTGLMGIRIAVKIRFVDSFELFMRYWRTEHPVGASRLRSHT